MQKEAPLFKSAAQELGYSDVIIGGSVSDSLQKKQHTIQEVLNNADRLGIKIIKD